MEKNYNLAQRLSGNMGKGKWTELQHFIELLHTYHFHLQQTSQLCMTHYEHPPSKHYKGQEPLILNTWISHIEYVTMSALPHVAKQMEKYYSRSTLWLIQDNYAQIVHSVGLDDQ